MLLEVGDVNMLEPQESLVVMVRFSLSQTECWTQTLELAVVRIGIIRS